MALTIQGFGAFYLRDVANGELTPLRPNAFTISQDITTETILAYPDSGTNTLQTLETVTTETTYTLNVETGSFQDMTFPLLFNQKASTESNVVTLKQAVVNVPAVSTFTVTVTGLTEDQVVQATLLRTSSPGDLYLTQIDAADVGTIAAGEFAVTANTLTFHSSAASASVSIAYEVTEASLSIIGGPAAVTPFIDGLEFFGKARVKASADTWNFWTRNLSKTEGIEFSSDSDSLPLSFSMGTYSGWNTPFLLYKQTA
jgi:hypothetical protein